MDSDDDCPELIDAKVPVVVLTGFLGSGKTTLLQYILTEHHGLKIAVIVNEFEFGRSIEKGLTMKSSEKADDEWLELNNGCLCCTAKTQTVLALENLIATKGSLDLILIETSGMADPAPIAAMFWQDDALQSALFLAGIITLVDMFHISKYLDEGGYREALQQLLVADKIIFNKVDLVPDEETRNAIARRVAAINPVAETEFTSFSRIADLRSVLSLDTTNVDVAAYLAAKQDVVQRAAAAHGHSAGLTSTHFEISGKAFASKYAVDEAIAKLVFRDSDDEEVNTADAADGASSSAGAAKHGAASPSGPVIVRMKAAVWVLGATIDAPPVLMQVQSIGELFDVVSMASAASVPYLSNRFLVLGKDLDAEGMRAAIAAALIDVQTPASSTAVPPSS